MNNCWIKTLASFGMAGGLLLSTTSLNAQEGVAEEFMPSGATKIQGGYSPIRAVMDQKDDIVKKAPEDIENPKFGYLEQGDMKWAFILDETEEGDGKLYVDTNGDGDLTNDPEATWKVTKRGSALTFNGTAKIEIGPDKIGAVNLYRFDPNDKRRAALKNTMLYYFDYGTKYTITLDGKTIETGVAGSVSDGSRLSLDRNDDGKISRNFETVKVGTPFNFTGTTYVLKAEDSKLTIEKAEKELPEAPMPPDLRIGKPTLSFTATTIDGDDIEFPTTFKGKIIMLDFWATWCGPCVAEIPNMKNAYAEWHDKGFEILGVSLDQKDKEEMLQKYREDKELPWPQIYDGNYWNAAIAKQHDVSGIPFVLLVDGDTGEILGTSRELRGPKLTAFVGKQLLKKELITEEELEAAGDKKDEKKADKKKADKEDDK